MLTAPLLLALALVAPTETSACPEGPTPSLRLGSSKAPIEVDVFLDPASSQSFRAWIELRRLVADYGGELKLRIHWATTGGVRSPRSERVRAFVASLAARGHATAVLRVVARDGVERLHARLLDPPSHRALADELSVPLPQIRHALTDRCARPHVTEESENLRRALSAERGAVLRLPAFVIGEHAFDDGPSLDRLRPELGTLGHRTRLHEDPPEALPLPPMQATSDRMQRPELPGVLLGGPGLPHRFVVMGRDENDPALIVALPPVLTTRREQPGRMAVHVVARGLSEGANQLRHRLCAAQALGLGPAYLDYLSRDALLREEQPGPFDEPLIAELDEIPMARCKDEVDPVDLDLPDGAWLDGLPRSRAELGTLDATLHLLDSGTRPLDWVLLGVDQSL